jgi:hypothetical protein
MVVYDRVMAFRAAVATALLALLAFAIIGATDEASSWGIRTARLGAIVPIVAGIGAALTLGDASARGEMRALAALGASHLRCRRGALAGAAFIGLLGVMLLGSPAADLRGLYPRLESVGHLRVVGSAFVDDVRAVRIDEQGEIARLPGFAAEPASVDGERTASGSRRIWTLLAFLVAAAAAPAWAAAPIRGGYRAGVAVGVALAEVTLFHWVALDRGSPAVLLGPPVLLCFVAAIMLRDTRWAIRSRSS